MVNNKNKMQPSTSKDALRKVQPIGEVSSRSYNKITLDSKNSNDYVERRNKNNEAVRKSREKAKLKQEQIQLQTHSCDEMTLLHKHEHQRLNAMIDTLRKIITEDSGPRDEELVRQILIQDNDEHNKFKSKLRSTKQRHLNQIQQLQTSQNSNKKM